MQACPHQAAALLQAAPADTGQTKTVAMPRLWRSSEVEQLEDPDHPLARMLDWVKSYLAQPHPELGRRGAVCPFVPEALEVDSIQLALVADPAVTRESIAQIITRFRDVFLATEPTRGPGAMQKAFLVVFPELGSEGAALVDEVQFSLKRYFVEHGLMLGEFHATNQSPGLRNPDFFPLRSPVPMLAIRNMVDSDLPFLIREGYPAAERASFLRSFVFRLGSGLTPSRFEQALNGLIGAEIEMWSAKAAVDTAAFLLARSQQPGHASTVAP
jgi:hypothetical protein